MVVESQSIADWASEQFTDRLADLLPFDVPKGLVNATHRAAIDDSTTPEILTMHDLPQVLHALWILSNQQLREIFNSPCHCLRLPLERGLSPPVQSGLIRLYLYKNPIAHPGVHHDG